MNSRKTKSSKGPKMVQRNVPFDSHLLQLMENEKNLEEVKSIITKENLFNVTDNMKDTLLHHAAKYGNPGVAKYLIDSGCKVDAQNFRKKTPLMSAYENFENGERVGEVLIEAGANIYINDETGSSVLQGILSEEWFEKKNAQFFLKVLQVDCSNDQEKIAKNLAYVRWPFYKIIQLGDGGITKLMLDRGYVSKKKVNKAMPDYPHLTPLHLAVRNIDLANVKVLLDYNANVNAMNSNNRTPLSYVYNPKKNDDDYFFFEDFDDDFEDIDDDGNIPEHSEERLMILKMLLERTSKKDIRKHRVHNILKYGNEEAIKLLFQSNINPMSATDLDENITIHLLVQNRNPGAIEQLRSQKFNVNALNEDGQTPLMFAVRSRNVNAVEFFLNEGADIDAANVKGYTALFFATDCDLGKEELAKECVQKLLEHGANVQIEIADDDDEPTIFDEILEYETYVVGEILEYETYVVGELLLAHLALQEAKGTSITQLIRSKIESNQRFKNFFELSKQQLKMKIYQSINLFELLTASNKKLEQHVCNEEFVLKAQDLVCALSNNSYFHSTLQKRISKAKHILQLKQAAIAVLCKIMDISYEGFPYIIDNIIDRLEQQDLQNLMNI